MEKPGAICPSDLPEQFGRRHLFQRGECFARHTLAGDERLARNLAGAGTISTRAVAAEHQLI